MLLCFNFISFWYVIDHKNVIPLNMSSRADRYVETIEFSGMIDVFIVSDAVM